MRGRERLSTDRKLRKVLLRIFTLLNHHFGNLHWWPASSPFEVIVGAILTQNTNWQNVEKAIGNIKASGLMSPEALWNAEDGIVAQLIRPSGYFNIKTARLKSFVGFLAKNYKFDLDKMFRQNEWSLRDELLSIKGIGKETADSILLYAGEKAVFVIDAYTKRMMTRHGLVESDVKYDEMQQMFMRHLPSSPALYNQYHALIVNAGKTFCTKKAPRCRECPLHVLLEA
jgi:endonuclease-3 related protein